LEYGKDIPGIRRNIDQLKRDLDEPKSDGKVITAAVTDLHCLSGRYSTIAAPGMHGVSRSSTLSYNHPQRKQEHVMAQKVQTLFIDDIDGGEAEGTVRFSLDGTEYEIDLSTAHSDDLRKALGTYIEHGRKISGTARRAGRGTGRRNANGAVDTAKAREWAKDQGLEIKDRGRVPADVVEKYRAATGQ
jgi:hypothetical protein